MHYRRNLFWQKKLLAAATFLKKIIVLLLLQETANINCSLLALQKVIDAKSANSFFVNYRESVLTRLLKECFGGNSITHLLATISPELQYTGLSIGTLRFASKAALVRQSPRLNIDPFITAVKGFFIFCCG